MKIILCGLFVMGLVLPGLAVDKAELDGRIRTVTTKLEALQAKPDLRIPAQNLRKAQAIVLLDRTKAGFMFAFQGGKGVVLARDPKSGQWSAPGFVTSSEASLGFQAGGQQSFVVILLMNTNAARAFAEGSSSFGGEASGTAGNASGGVQSTTSQIEPLSLVYSDAEGFYGGAAVKGGSIMPDQEADVVYYGQYLTMKEILFDQKAQPTGPGLELAQKIDQYANAK